MTDLNITEEENWDIIYQLPFKSILSTKLQSFQYKLSLRILYTNSMLLKYGLSETELCSFCFETKESLIHLLYECRFVRSLWLQLTDNMRSKCGIIIQFNVHLGFCLTQTVRSLTPVLLSFVTIYMFVQ